MKRLIIALTTFMCITTCIAQTTDTKTQTEVRYDARLTDKEVRPLIQPNGTFSIVIQSTGNKDQCYQTIREFLVTYDHQYNDNKQLEDKEAGKLIFNVTIPFDKKIEDGSVTHRYIGAITTTVTIDCKDGRYRAKNTKPSCDGTEKYYVDNEEVKEIGNTFHDRCIETIDLDLKGKLMSQFRNYFKLQLNAMRTYVEKQKDDDF